MRDRNMPGLLLRRAVVGEHRRLPSLHSIATHCCRNSDNHGDGIGLSDGRVGGKCSNPAAPATTTRLVRMRSTGSFVSAARNRGPQNLFHFFDQLAGCKWRGEYVELFQDRAVLKPVILQKTSYH